MVKGKYALGIAFVAIILSTVLIVMGAGPAIVFNTPPTPQDAGTVPVNYVNISITLNESGNASLKWNGSVTNEPMIGSGTNFYINKTGLTNGQYSYIISATNTTSGNSTTSPTRTVTVNVVSPLPKLSNQNPASPVTSTFNFSQKFNVTVDQTANVSWKYGDTEVQNVSVSEGARSEYVSNATQPIGTYSVTATAHNANGTSAPPITWNWNVQGPQGPPPVSNIDYTRGATWINWTWTNPSTGDFNYSTVKINTTSQSNTSKNYFNLTQLAPNSTNKIALQTVDNSGNINSTIISSQQPLLIRLWIKCEYHPKWCESCFLSSDGEGIHPLPYSRQIQEVPLRSNQRELSIIFRQTQHLLVT